MARSKREAKRKTAVRDEAQGSEPPRAAELIIAAKNEKENEKSAWHLRGNHKIGAFTKTRLRLLQGLANGRRLSIAMFVCPHTILVRIYLVVRQVRAWEESRKMFISKRHIARRLVLRGMGVRLGLPFLDAMAAAQTRLTTARGRLACIEMVHGAAGCSDAGAEQHYWSPRGEGRDFELSYSLRPLTPFRDSLTIVSGTDARQAEAFVPSEVGGDHFRSAAVFLTGVRPKQTNGADFRVGPSIDQLYARHIEGQTPVQSLQLGIEFVERTNSCGFSYNCIYADAISWASPTIPLLPVINPRRVFENLFGGLKVVDGTTADAARLRGAIGSGDRIRLDEYLHDVRDVERRIQGIEKHNANAEKRDLYSAPIGVPDSWEEHVKLMFDMQVLAFAADITRISTFKLSRDVSNRLFPMSGVKAPFHSLSHHNEAPAMLLEFAKLNRYHVSLIPYFLDKLKRSPDGDGSLLDHSIVLYGSSMGDSQTHNHRRVPLFLAGGGCGQLQGNLHRICKDGTPQANLLLTVLRKLGVPQVTVGDSTGEISI